MSYQTSTTAIEVGIKHVLVRYIVVMIFVFSSAISLPALAQSEKLGTTDPAQKTKTDELITFRMDDQKEFLLPGLQDPNNLTTPYIRKSNHADRLDQVTPCVAITVTIGRKFIAGHLLYQIKRNSVAPAEQFSENNLGQLGFDNFLVEYSYSRRDSQSKAWIAERMIAVDRSAASSGVITLYVTRGDHESYYDDFTQSGGMLRVSLILYGKGIPTGEPFLANCALETKEKAPKKKDNTPKTKDFPTEQRLYAPIWAKIGTIKGANATLIPDIGTKKTTPVVQTTINFPGELPFNWLQKYLPRSSWNLVGSAVYSSQPLDPSGRFLVGFTHDVSTSFTGQLRASIYHVEIDNSLSESGGDRFSTARFGLRIPIENHHPTKPTAYDKLLTTYAGVELLTTYPYSLDSRLTAKVLAGPSSGTVDFGLNKSQWIVGNKVYAQYQHSFNTSFFINAVYELYWFPLNGVRGGNVLHGIEHHAKIFLSLPGTGGTIGPGYEFGLDDSTFLRYKGMWTFSYKASK